MAMKKFVIIDGNALLHRAYHALPPFTTKDGILVNAVYGFASTLLKIFREINPEYIAVAFDTAAPTFRHKQYKEYKATREKKPQELYNQIDYIKKMLKAMNVPFYEKDGFEGDDIIATLTKTACQDSKKVESIIVTGDMDTVQLVSGCVKVNTFKKGLSDTIIFGEKEVLEKFGLPPEQMIDYKALRGDPSDNIPGVAGIGEKGGRELIKQFGSVENLYKELEKDSVEAKKLSARTRELLTRHKADAFLGKKLVTLDADAPIDFSLDFAKRKSFDGEALVQFLSSLGFASLIKRFKEASAREPKGAEETVPGKTSLRREKIIENEAEALLALKKVSGPTVIRTRAKNKIISALIIFALEGKYFIQSPKNKIISAVRDFFQNPKAVIAGHDLKNEMRVLGCDAPRASFADIMLASYLLDPGTRRHDLKNSAFTVLGMELPEEEKQQTLLGGDTRDKEILIAEAEAIAALRERFEKELKEKNLYELYAEIEAPLLPILFEMENYGILIDADFLKMMSEDAEKKIAKLEKKIWELAGAQFNINSPAQLADVLFNKLKISAKSIKKTATGAALSTAAGELEKLRGVHPVVDFIFEYRELAKLKSTYIDALPELADKTKRVHTTFNQTVTATGRLSSSCPNLQNIPVKTELGREIRKAFIAKEGYSLLSADYSQIELRIAAHMSGDKTMIEDFRNGEDIHTRTAEIIWGVGHEDVTSEMRRIAKAINFGIIYGMGPKKLAAEAGVSMEEARDFISRFFSGRPRLKEYIEELKALAAAQGYVETMFGRRRYLSEITSGVPMLRAEAERQAVNTPIQGTSADIIKIAMINLFNALEKHFGKDAAMVLQVHDELVFEIKDSIIHKAAGIIRENMETAVKLSVPVIVEIDIGK
ncbi:DNA polymerase I, partial [Candidatus Uhrbacteria bacterium]|nr:DNA polymerase I [Candidatus Uhrbacteria bacterium]